MTNKIGIIGGSGAFATSFLLQKINEYSAYIYKSKTDSDFLHTVTISTPHTNLDAKRNSQKDTFMCLLSNLHELEDMNCNVIVIACNSLHEHWESLNSARKNENTVLLNLPQIVSSFVEKDEKTIGILCSDRCRELELYKPLLKLNNQRILYPTQQIQDTITDCIKSVTMNDTRKQFKHLMDISLYSLFEQNVDSVIIASAELSIIKPIRVNKNLYDSVDLLAIFLNENYK